ncbi:MAG: AraC family transcriptional regulator [Nostoc sp.]|uniref:helix-turn-helix transcriptional regulator n=1 Tax=Nostoc sp. TaxID=1180 RepID=UPI002FF53CBA
MANIISQSDYAQLWQANVQYLDPSDNSDATQVCPQQFGKGYERVIQLHGIKVLIINEEFHQDLDVEYPSGKTEGLVEFGFNLTGVRGWIPSCVSFLELAVPGADCEEYLSERKAGERILKIDIALKPAEFLQNFAPEHLTHLSSELRQFFEKPEEEISVDINTITPQMRVAIEQIFNCPFQGLIKHLYFEAKCIELIALKLEQLKQIEKTSLKSIILKPDDIDRIHYAKEILIQNIDNPPSLLDLARQVGFNDYKLKLGFRQEFGTTVFGYLHLQRMEKARQLLLEGRMSVKEVACTVGYANQSRFAAAFRKRFGVNPKSYQ